MDEAGTKHGFSVEKAHEAQLRLAKQIVFEDRLPRKIRFVGGVDVAYVGHVSIGAVAVLDFDSLKLVESQTSFCRTSFPYVPTLLSFREIRPALLSIRKLRVKPDLFLVDGHGYAHPYRCGFASHLGLIIDVPAVGVAKSKLVGEVENVKGEDRSFIHHRGEIIGAAIATKPESKPIYVSVGHMISLTTAVKIVKQCISIHRIPEPILKAHQIATAEKRKINISSTAKTSNK